MAGSQPGHTARARERAKRAGIRNAERERWGLEHVFPDASQMAWMRRFSFPFSENLTKNNDKHIRARSGVCLRRPTRHDRDALTMVVATALRGVRVVNAKLWIDLLVQKPNHRWDAINFVDHVADAIKHAIPLDDRWYCYRRVDWQVAKSNPSFLIGVGQEAERDMQLCAYCGRILELEMFQSSRNTKLGVGRECKECVNTGKRWQKA